VFDLVLPAGFDDRMHQVRMRHRDRQKQRFRGIKKPVDMFLELEYTAVVSANPFKDAIAIQESMVKYRNLCLVLRKKGSVDVNFHAHHRDEGSLGRRGTKARDLPARGKSLETKKRADGLATATGGYQEARNSRAHKHQRARFRYRRCSGETIDTGSAVILKRSESRPDGTITRNVDRG
ncbi:MAG: hypothetical protein JWM99_856, partial [Verrucomicrobiales bacterium]|nr:hypothetical protein [Verrucomicrobiales bacterium]